MGLCNRNKWFFFIVGILVGLVICAPIIMINPVASPPTSYDTIITENKFVYNQLFFNYVGISGSAIDGDVALQQEFEITESVYDNVAVMLLGNNDTNIYALCFYDTDKTTIYIQNNPEINNLYEMENANDFLGVIVFYHRSVESVLEVVTWIW